MSKNRFIFLAVAAVGGVLLTACQKAPEATPASAPTVQATTVAAAPAADKEVIELMHIHGLSYSPDGSKILIPSHHGMAVFDGAGWSKAAGPQHDYMGFSASQNALYSSGHPAPDSGLVNPFGVIKSTDGGQTWQKLGMEGESDFHLLATSYASSAIYVVNHQQNSKMKGAGIYATFNDGFSWQRAAATGLNSAPTSLAVHPSNPKTIAAGTENGWFLSQNAGDTFQRIGDGKIAALSFDLNGKHLWLGTFNAEAGLTRFDLDSKEINKISLPAMQKDAIAYIAQNPVKRSELAIATLQRSAYLSRDEGKTWKQIADQGKTL